MSSYTTVTYTTPNAALGQLGGGAAKYKFGEQLVKFVKGIFSQTGYNSIGATVKAVPDAVRAFVTVTFTGAPSADETMVLGGYTFTAKASGATGDQFNIGGTVTITATNLAAAVNASTNVSSILTASSAAGVVTITCKYPGLIGNFLAASESMTNTAMTNNTGSRFNSGAETNAQTFSW